MTREQVAKKIRWQVIFAIIGLFNPVVGLPQLWSLVTTGQHEGLSLPTFFLMFVIVAGFAVDGFFNRNRIAARSMAAAALVNGANFTLLTYFRREAILEFSTSFFHG